MCVNDAFVMDAWGKELGIEKVKLIPDGDGKLLPIEMTVKVKFDPNTQKLEVIT